MRTTFVKKLMLTSTLLMALASGASAQTYSPQSLETVIQRAQALTAQGRRPVVMFDLDDTLINTRERNIRILRDFVTQPEVRTQFPEESAKVQRLTMNQVRYLQADTLKGIGITNPDFVKAAGEFWLPLFFSNEYCAHDQQNPGAAKYLHELARSGALIVYLTGRDVPRMQDGTILSLKRNFFPATRHNTVLLMKPDAQIDDLAFKKEALAKVASYGEVIGVFENEPANMNAMVDAFPQATAVFIDTIHSPKPDVPYVSVNWVKDFRH